MKTDFTAAALAATHEEQLNKAAENIALSVLSCHALQFGLGDQLHTLLAETSTAAQSPLVNTQKMATLQRNLADLPCDTATRSAFVTALALQNGVYDQCQAQFPTPEGVSLFAQHDQWERNFAVVYDVIQQKRAEGGVQDGLSPYAPGHLPPPQRQ